MAPENDPTRSLGFSVRGNKRRQDAFGVSSVKSMNLPSSPLGPSAIVDRQRQTSLAMRGCMLFNCPGCDLRRIVNAWRLLEERKRRPDAGQALIEPSQPAHRIVRDACHRAFLLRSDYFAIGREKKASERANYFQLISSNFDWISSVLVICLTQVSTSYSVSGN